MKAPLNSIARNPLRNAVVICLIAVGARAQELGPPPIAPTGEPFEIHEDRPKADVVQAVSNGWIDTADREAVRNFYNNVLVPSGNVPIGWTGAIAGCIAGDTSAAYKDAVALRRNWFRSMSGVPSAVTLNGAFNVKDQAGAVMLSANRALSHSPPANWLCYTADAADAVSHSNICISTGFFNDPGCISLYIRDHGANNTAAGHRRWILFPQTQTMGTGDVAQSGSGSGAYPFVNALWVLPQSAPPRPATRDEFVAWPPRGFVPYQVVYPRWSFSMANANFTSATVTMLRGGQFVPVRLESVQNGYGENTIVWVPDNLNADSFSAGWPAPGSDTTIDVSILNVVVGGVPRNISYSVTIFAPNQSGLGAPTNPVPSNGASGLGTNAALSWSAVTGATSYDVYFGTPVNPPFVANIAGTSYSPGSLAAGTTYYWRAVAKNGSASSSSPVWSFSTLASTPPAVVIDVPFANSTVSGIVLIAGWALDNLTSVETGISKVEVLVDGVKVGDATYGDARPGVCAAYPGRAGCPNVGYAFQWNTAGLTAGAHTIVVRATDSDSIPKVGLSASRVVTVSGGSVGVAPPAAVIDVPFANSTVSGIVPIVGWALDNLASAETAISKVEVLVDGVKVGDATYGDARPGVCGFYPGRPGCPNVGYVFQWNTAGFAAGPHTIVVRATDSDSTPKVGLSASRVVTVSGGTVGVAPPAVIVDVPFQNSTVSGIVPVVGWALDNLTSVETAISKVEVLVDGVKVGDATYGDARAGVCAAYPGRPGCPNVGYVFQWSTAGFSAGAHTIVVRATDSDSTPKIGLSTARTVFVSP